MRSRMMVLNRTAGDSMPPRNSSNRSRSGPSMPNFAGPKLTAPMEAPTVEP
jgi:hypothetical protein